MVLTLILALVLLVAGLGALGYAVWTYVWPAVRFRPGLTPLARPGSSCR